MLRVGERRRVIDVHGFDRALLDGDDYRHLEHEGAARAGIIGEALLKIDEGRFTISPLDSRLDALQELTSVEGEQHPLYRRPYNRRKPIPRRPSMLDDVQDQLRAWLGEQPDVTAVEVLARLEAMYPDRLMEKHLRTIQRAVKDGRAQAARRIIVDSVAAVTVGIPVTSHTSAAAAPSAA
jgi:hypothetical protein